MKISKCVLVGAVSASLGALAGVAVAHFARPCRAKCSSEEEVPTLDIADGDFTDKTFVAQQLMQVCPQLIADFVEHCAQHYELTEAQRERLAKMLEFNVVGGKMNRAIFLVVTAASLAKHDGKEFDKTMQRKALVLGWCIEYLQACFLVADDVMDGSETRRGQPCWYKMPGVGLDAINDALILESVIFFLTKQHFPSSQERLAFDELMRQTSLQTQMGQMFDVMGEAKDRDREEVLASFSLDQHRQIVQYKTAYYSFYMPLAAGMMLSGYGSPEQLKLCEVRLSWSLLGEGKGERCRVGLRVTWVNASDTFVLQEIAVAMGVKFQIQDDYLDCFQKPVRLSILCLLLLLLKRRMCNTGDSRQGWHGHRGLQVLVARQPSAHAVQRRAASDPAGPLRQGRDWR
ncbi:MAG: hypothetical protein MHM6MM_004831 [Cercozoa sp. M6MM]